MVKEQSVLFHHQLFDELVLWWETLNPKKKKEKKFRLFFSRDFKHTVSIGFALKLIPFLKLQYKERLVS